MTLVTRALDPRADTDAAVDLLLRCQSDRPMDKWPTAQELRLMLNGSSSEDVMTMLWADNHKDVGFTRLSVSGSTANLMLFTEPRTDGSVEQEILTRVLAQMKENGWRMGETVKLYVRPIETDVSLMSVLEELRFTREDWHVVRLSRSLHEPIPDPVLPDGFTIRPVLGEIELAAYVAMHRDAFGTDSKTVTERLDFMRSPAYVPALDLVAVAPGGELAAFVVGSVDPEEMTRLGWRQGWTDPVGTRPAFQRRRLARALLFTSFRGLRERGVSTAITGTGSWNHPMLRLAESVGFGLAHRVLAYSKSV